MEVVEEIVTVSKIIKICEYLFVIKRYISYISEEATKQHHFLSKVKFI